MAMVDVAEMVLVQTTVLVEDERRFREPRSTFSHLRSITSAEVMAAFSCRGRIGVWSVFLVPTSSLLSLSLSFARSHCDSLEPASLPTSLAPLSTSVCPFVHVLSGHCGRGIVGGALSKFARDCAPFEAHLIDQVLMKMIPGAT